MRRTDARWLAIAALLGTLSPIAGCPSTPTATAPTTTTQAASASASASGSAAHAIEPFAIAAENAEAAAAAEGALRAGGDAVDATVAAALVLGVATPTACGIGGGGFAVVWRAKEQTAYVIDFRETAPAKIDSAAFAMKKKPPELRGASMGIPGETLGLHTLVARWGRRTWKEDVEPAIEVARRGPAMTAHTARALAYFGKDLPTLVPEFASEWIPGGVVRAVGERSARTHLAETLTLIADQGPRVLYEGAIASEIVAAATKAGATLTLDDLKHYTTVDRAPLHVHWKGPNASAHGREIFTMPPPSAGGVMLAELLVADDLLRARDGHGLDRDAWESGAYVHRVDELMRGAIDDRARFIGDPEMFPVDSNKLTGAAWLGARIAKLDDHTTHKPIDLRVEEHGTSHVSVLDGDGNAVSLTTTVNLPFGAMVEVPGRGIMLNDQLDDFSDATPPSGDPGLARPDGMVTNAPRPGARPTSSMTPTIVVEDGKVVAVIGGSGGMRIATSVTWVTLATLLFGIDPATAIAAPRIHPSGADLYVEAGTPAELRKDLTSRGETIKEGPVFNAVTMIGVDRSGATPVLRAAGDARKGGVGIVSTASSASAAASASAR
jgi:gamma-glutamyltranspeptidase/glutathione hydrolase